MDNKRERYTCQEKGAIGSQQQENKGDDNDVQYSRKVIKITKKKKKEKVIGVPLEEGDLLSTCNFCLL